MEKCEDCILRLNATLDWLIFNDRAKTKLTTLAILYCREIVKNSIRTTKSCANSPIKSLVSADSVNMVAAWQTTDWSVPNS